MYCLHVRNTLLRSLPQQMDITEVPWMLLRLLPVFREKTNVCGYRDGCNAEAGFQRGRTQSVPAAARLVSLDARTFRV